MINFWKALNVVVDNHTIIKDGYIQLPGPATITEDWINAASPIHNFNTNRDSVIQPLVDWKITEQDLKPFIGKTVYAVPDDTIYGAYLETLARDIMMDQDYMAPDKAQEFLQRSDEYIENTLSQYAMISEVLINRIWSYELFKREMIEDRLLTSYKTLCTICGLQLLLMISVLTPNYNLDDCFKK